MAGIFDEIVDRSNTGSLKWDVNKGELPMWVADMDFRTAPCITEAFVKRAEHGIYGYTLITDEWYEAYMSWWKNRHDFAIERDWLVFCTGVVPAISSIVRKLTTVGENVVVMTPVYNIFFNSIINNGRKVLESKLIYKDGEYSIDYDDLNSKLADSQTTMLLLCNPHNPIGKIWDRDTLQRIGQMCADNNLLVVSDEIHCDIVKPGLGYIPFASVSDVCRDNSITCVSPTKAFNIAGIQTAAVIVPNRNIRAKVDRGLNTDEVAEPNVFAQIAPIAAFGKGGSWLDDLNAYLWENRVYAEEFISCEIPSLFTVKGEATYLLWIDCTQMSGLPQRLGRYVRETSGLYLSDGRAYRNGEGFLRMNLACPRALLEDGLKRLKKSMTGKEVC